MCKKALFLMLPLIICLLMVTPAFADSSDEKCYYGGVEYTSSTDEVIEIIRDNLTNRIPEFSVYYASKKSVDESCVRKWINLARTETGDPCQGDYLKYIFGKNSGFRINYVFDEGIYYYKIYFIPNCRSSAEQEKFVDKKVDEILNSFNFTEDTSDFVKVRKIYDYVVKNISYDKSYKNETAYSALADKKTTCIGYSQLLYRLLGEVEVSNRIVLNESKNHCWNIVKLGDKYYQLDAVHDRALYDRDGYISYAYFLKGYNSSYYTGIYRVDDSYTKGDFAKEYPISKSDYKFNSLPAPEKVVAKVCGSHDDIKVTWSKVEGASGYYVYYKKYGDSSYSLLGRTVNRNMKISNLLDGSKYVFRVVPYVKIGGVRYKSKYGNTDSVYTLKKLDTPSVSLNSIDSVVVSWKNIPGEKGYQISCSKSKTGTNVVSTYETSVGDSAVVYVGGNTRYYYKVRAYNEYRGEKVYGPWSDVKSFKL